MLNQKVSNMHLCFNFSKLYWPNSSNFASNLIRLHSQNVIRQNNSQIEYLLRGKNTIWKEKVICFAWLLLFYWLLFLLGWCFFWLLLTARLSNRKGTVSLLICLAADSKKIIYAEVWQQDNDLRLQKRRTAVSLLIGAWHLEDKTGVTLLLCERQTWKYSFSVN